jgi:hypothetical protein
MTIVDFKFNEMAIEYAVRHGYGAGECGGHGLVAMRESMENYTAGKGFGFIDDGLGEPLQAYEQWTGYYQCECVERVVKVNSETALSLFKEAGVETWDWKGMLVFDASKRKGREIAQQITNSLYDYPLLSDDRHSELEWDDAVSWVESLNIPDGIDAGDVVNLLSEIPHCGHCSSIDEDDVIEVLKEMGWRRCADNCGDWLKTEKEDALCYDCAESASVVPACEHVFLTIDTAKHNGFFLTEQDMRKADEACEDCSDELCLA